MFLSRNETFHGQKLKRSNLKGDKLHKGESKNNTKNTTQINKHPEKNTSKKLEKRTPRRDPISLKLEEGEGEKFLSLQGSAKISSNEERKGVNEQSS